MGIGEDSKDLRVRPTSLPSTVKKSEPRTKQDKVTSVWDLETQRNIPKSSAQKTCKRPMALGTGAERGNHCFPYKPGRTMVTHDSGKAREGGADTDEHKRHH